MVPAFQTITGAAYSGLPEGVHQVSVADVRAGLVDPFPASKRRPMLYSNWLTFRQLVRGLLNVQSEFIDGSFATDWLEPKDVDVSFTVAAIELDLMPESKAKALDGLWAQRGNFLCDAYIVAISPPTHPGHAVHKTWEDRVDSHWVTCRDKNWTPMVGGPPQGLLRGRVMSREDLLREELTSLADIAAQASSSEAFSTRFIGVQASLEADATRQQLDDLINRRLDLHLSTDGASHAVSTTVLGRILTQFQSAVTHVVWALGSGPAVVGHVPASVAHSASTDVLAFAPGSLDVVIRRTTLDMTSEFDEAIGALLDVASVTDLAGPDELGATLVGEIGPEATKRVKRFFGGLGEAELNATFEWRGEKARTVMISPEDSRFIASWLSAADQMQSSLTVNGVVRMADTRTGHFAIELSGGDVYEGRAASPELLSDVRIDAVYGATLSVLAFTNVLTGSERQIYTLTSIAEK